jgi:hypothetical protein
MNLTYAGQKDTWIFRTKVSFKNLACVEIKTRILIESCHARERKTQIKWCFQSANCIVLKFKTILKLKSLKNVSIFWHSTVCVKCEIQQAIRANVTLNQVKMTDFARFSYLVPVLKQVKKIEKNSKKKFS